MSTYRRLVASVLAGLMSLLFVGASSMNALGAPSLTLTPASIVWNTNAWVNFDLAGITPGSAVNLSVYVDVDKNGQAGPVDTLLMQFDLKDGVTNGLGAQIIVSDTNSVADGQISGRVSYNGLVDIAQVWHASGTYLWQAAYTNGIVITSAVFTVTQPTSAVWISGTVKRLTNAFPRAGVKLPGAVVIPQLFSDIQGGMPATWTDTNGNFTIYLPAGMSTNNLYGVMAIKPDYLTAGGGEPLSTYDFGHSLSNGENALTNSLFLVQAIPGLVSTVSGTVMDGESNTLAGVLLMVESENEGGMSFGMSKSNGTYSIPWPADAGPSIVKSVSPLLNMRGYMGSGMSFTASPSDISGLDLICPMATTLARVRVVNSEGSAGVIGAKVCFLGNMTGSESFTFDTNGLSELCVVGAVGASAEIQNESLRSSHRVCPVDEVAGLTIPDSGVFTNVEFSAYPGVVVSGYVFDSLTNPLPGGFVYAQATNQSSALDGESPDFSGYYELLVNADTYDVGTWDYNQMGYADQRREDAVTVASEAVTNINFYLEQSATISGRVSGGGGPLSNVEIQAGLLSTNEWGDSQWQHVNSGRTDVNGDYTLSVPAGIAYAVAYMASGSGSWLDQYYSNTADSASATLVTPTVEAPVTNINFSLQPGATISGRVLADGNPLENAGLWASLLTPRDGGGWDSQGVTYSQTDADGYYTLLVPPDVAYGVSVHRPDGTTWIEQYYSNAMDEATATLVTPTIDTPVTNIDFSLQAGATISGIVMAGGNPMQNAQIAAAIITNIPESGWNTQNFAWTQTDGAGSYTLVVPSGVTCGVRAQAPDGTPWLEQYYSNATGAASAMLLTPTVLAPAVNIDFDLQPASQIQGRVTDRTTGLPITGMFLTVVSIPDTNNFGHNSSYYGGQPTDDNGDYSVLVPSGSNYLVHVNSGDTYYLFQCWSNQVNTMQSTLLTLGTAETVSNIDFALDAGGRISGHIYRDDGGAPLGDCDVSVMDEDSWSDGRRTDSSGSYSLVVPAGATCRVRVMPGNTGLPYRDEWYNDATDWASAQTVNVALTNEVSGIDISLMVGNLETNIWWEHYFTSGELGDGNISGDDADPDQDGASNLEEYLADTDPRRSNSVLRVTGQGRSGGNLNIAWAGGHWATQYLERCSALSTNTAAWTAIYTNAMLPTGSTNIVLDADAAQPSLFYRIKVER